ncbi:hypothetical protein GCM10023205_60000 [Yinghuangia aomiensis]|uniref:Uncharacterized protein n=1 Tax=Yinghuangia aomiensis TaxID=676205 RepID=A0ABP9HZF9_9ACTN
MAFLAHTRGKRQTLNVTWEPLAAEAREHVRGQRLGGPLGRWIADRDRTWHDRHAAQVTARLNEAFDRRYAKGGEFRDEIKGASWGLRYEGDRAVILAESLDAMAKRMGRGKEARQLAAGFRNVSGALRESARWTYRAAGEREPWDDKWTEAYQQGEVASRSYRTPAEPAQSPAAVSEATALLRSAIDKRAEANELAPGRWHVDPPGTKSRDVALAYDKLAHRVQSGIAPENPIWPDNWSETPAELARTARQLADERRAELAAAASSATPRRGPERTGPERGGPEQPPTRALRQPAPRRPAPGPRARAGSDLRSMTAKAAAGLDNAAGLHSSPDPRVVDAQRRLRKTIGRVNRPQELGEHVETMLANEVSTGGAYGMMPTPPVDKRTAGLDKSIEPRRGPEK